MCRNLAQGAVLFFDQVFVMVIRLCPQQAEETEDHHRQQKRAQAPRSPNNLINQKRIHCYHAASIYAQTRSSVVLKKNYM